MAQVGSTYLGDFLEELILGGFGAALHSKTDNFLRVSVLNEMGSLTSLALFARDQNAFFKEAEWVLSDLNDKGSTLSNEDAARIIDAIDKVEGR